MPADRPVSFLGLAARLFVRNWPALLFWFFAGYIANDLLMALAVKLGYMNRLLGFWGVALVVVTQLAVTVAMFHTLRDDLPTIQASHTPEDDIAGAASVPSSTPLPAPAAGAMNPRDAADGAGGDDARWSRRQRLADAIALALVPFFAYYAAWGLLRDTVRQYSLDYLAGSWMGKYGVPTEIPPARGVIVSVIAAWGIRKICAHFYATRRGAIWSVLMTLCDAYWLFLGVLVISEWKGWGTGWWHSRVVHQAANDLWHAPSAWLPHPLAVISGWLAPVTSVTMDLIAAVTMPLVWLTLTAIIFGRDLARMRTLEGTDRRLADVDRRYAALPRTVKRGADRFVGGFKSKTLPVIGSLRLILHAGVRPTLMFCASYVALDWLRHWAWRGAAWLIGPHDIATWNVFAGPLSVLLGGPVDLVPTLAGEPLRICLLAAGLELALNSARENTAPDPQPAAAPASALNAGSGGSAAAPAAG